MSENFDPEEPKNEEPTQEEESGYDSDEDEAKFEEYETMVDDCITGVMDGQDEGDSKD